MVGRSVFLAAPRAIRGVAAPLLAIALLAGSLPLAAGARADVTHVVAPGETLGEIALRYGVAIDQIVVLNAITDRERIFAGTTLVISRDAPGSGAGLRHVVREGDSLSGIAERYGVNVGDLVLTNGIFNANLIFAGQVLIIPTAGSSTNPFSVVLPNRAPATPSQADRLGTPPPADATFDLPYLLSPSLESIFEAAAMEFGIDPPLLIALSLLESGWQQDVVSHAGAVGLMQLMPETATWVVEHLAPGATNWQTSATDNVRVGAAFLAHLIDLADGDVGLALAGYYQGWASVHSIGWYDDTRQYVDDVLALTARLR